MRLRPFFVAIAAALGAPAALISAGAANDAARPASVSAAPGSTYCVAVMGDVAYPGVYAETNELTLAELIERAGGLTREADGTVHLIRGGRIVQHVFLPTGGALPLLAGDLIAVGGHCDSRPSNAKPAAGGDDPAPAPAVQIAFLNLIDRPVVVKVRADQATPARIVTLLGQTPDLADQVRVIAPPLAGLRPAAEIRSARNRLESGTALVFPRRLIRANVLPALPQPIVRSSFASRESVGRGTAETIGNGIVASSSANQPALEVAPPPPADPPNETPVSPSAVSSTNGGKCAERRSDDVRRTVELLPDWLADNVEHRRSRAPRCGAIACEAYGRIPMSATGRPAGIAASRSPQFGPTMAVMGGMCAIAALAIVLTVVPMIRRYTVPRSKVVPADHAARARARISALYKVGRKVLRHWSGRRAGNALEPSAGGLPPLPTTISGMGRPVRIDANWPFTRLGIELAAAERSSRAAA